SLSLATVLALCVTGPAAEVEAELTFPAAPVVLTAATTNTAPVQALAYAADGKTLAVAREEREVYLLDPVDGRPRAVLRGQEESVMAVAFAPDGKTVATASPDNTVRLWEAATGKELHTLKGHTSWAYAVAFSPDGKTLASGGYDKAVRLWDPAT